jgi:hypothetical protein
MVNVSLWQFGSGDKKRLQLSFVVIGLVPIALGRLSPATVDVAVWGVLVFGTKGWGGPP